MENSGMNRRSFTKLSAAAFGGLLAGSRLVNAEDKKDEPKPGPKKGVRVLQEPHTCRGLNACKGRGGCGATKGKNSCAGTSECATAKHHACKGKNDCANQGGCGNLVGINDCKGHGECAVPLSDAAWGRARIRLQRQFAADGKTLGEAPKKK